jgi:diadenosine tetraphosphate (Ap4A) HIT family hydrolase
VKATARRTRSPRTVGLPRPAFLLVFALAPAFAPPVAAQRPCTAVPDLVSDWKRSSFGEDTSDAAVRARVDGARAETDSLPDPFTPIALMNPQRRKALGEWVLWEDSTAMVLVDKSHWHFGVPAVLVIPKAPIMFLTDSSSDFGRRLGFLAASASDAIALTVGRSCSDPLASQIFVNPPRVASIRQLHVHVVVTPPQPLDSSGLARVYDGAQRRLARIIANTGAQPDRR